MILLKNTLKRATLPCIPIIGINANVCLPFSRSNATQAAPNNMTNGSSGLPSMTVSYITNRQAFAFYLAENCALAGAAAYGGIGLLEAIALCT